LKIPSELQTGRVFWSIYAILAGSFVAALITVFLDADASAQATSPPQRNFTAEPSAVGSTSAMLLSTPVTTLIPGNVPVRPKLQNPTAKGPESATRGMRYFASFNCVGCHAPNGGGGMGPSLSNRAFIYGSEPANVYLTIYQGRPNGMPAWGAVLPDTIIWDLVAYIASISKDPTTTWGTTISAEALNIEQVPTEYLQAVAPWAHTQAFSHGQKPNRAR